MSRIHFIATARSQVGQLFLAAEFENLVEVWNVETGQRISRFHSILDGSRLALADDGLKCVAGNYRQGVALYNLGDCSEVWRRSDLRQLQYVRFSKSGQFVFCGFENGPGQVLNAKCGKTVRAWRGVRELFESPYDNRILLRKAKGCVITDAEQSAADVRIPSLRPGPLLDVAFSPEGLCFSEYSAVRCFNLKGREVWRSSLPTNEHLVALCYEHNLGAYFGIVSDLMSGETSLVRISIEDGGYRSICSLGRLQRVGFCRDSKLVCTNGAVWDLKSGDLVTRLWADIPQPESDRKLPAIEFDSSKNARALVERLWGSPGGDVD